MHKPIKLYTYALSPFGMKVYWALRLKQLPFELDYVNARTAEQIAFSKQRMVPVVTIGDAWKIDSTPIIHWLDKECPDNNLTGQTEADRQQIAEVDDWVTTRLIPASFRHNIDGENFVAMMDTGFKLASILNKTSGGVPRLLYPFWPFILRRASFVQQNAEMVAEFTTLKEMGAAIVRDLEQYIGEGPYLLGRDTPSLADAGAYAQIYASLALKMKGRADFRASPIISGWLGAVEAVLTESKSAPELYPNMVESVV